MKIAVIYTGGTIGSAAGEEYISLSQKSGEMLVKLYRERYERDVEFVAFSPYFIHSENLTFKELSKLADCVRSAIDMSFDGIIITHGTDTLQFTAAALRLIFSDCRVPVLIVSANYPLADKRSNGLANFASAVEFICRKIENGVFVSYKNTGKLPEIHSGSRLLAHGEFADEVYSVQGENFGCFANTCFIKNPNYTFVAPENGNLSLKTDFSAGKDILAVTPYAGFVYPGLRDNIRAVIHKSYHSGSIRTCGKDFEEFFTKCKEKNIPVFITGMSDDAIQYESTSLFREYGITPIANITFISAYMKLVLLLADGIENIAQRMLTPVSDEFFKTTSHNNGM